MNMVARKNREASDCTAMVVDDDALVRLGTITMARKLGFALDTAPDGPSALALIDGGKMPDILITDYDMPGMTGVELARNVTDQREDVDVLIVTGHTTLPEVLPERWKILRKPFTLAEFTRKLQSFGIQSAVPAIS